MSQMMISVKTEDLLFYDKPEETEPDTIEFKINGFTDAYIYASCPRAGTVTEKYIFSNKHGNSRPT